MRSETALVLLVAAALGLLAVGVSSALRERVHHAVALPAIWVVLLLLSVAALPLGFYRIEPVALLVFGLGALLFVAGAGLGEVVASGRTTACASPIDGLNFPLIATCSAVLNIVMLPLWWRELVQITDETELLAIAFRMRWISVLGIDRHSFLVGNWLVLGLIVTPVLALGAFRGRLPVLLVIAVCAPWIAGNVISNGRAGMVQTIVALLYLRATESKPIDIRTLLSVLAAFIGIFGAGVLLVSKGGVNAESSLSELGLGVVTNLLEYVTQGPILFSRWLAGLTDVLPSWDALVFPCTLLQAAGMCTVGELHQEFATFGSAFEQVGNVYTVYFSILPKYGWLGIVLLVAAYGAWAAFHHRRHRQRGALAHSLLAAQLFAATLLTGFSDAFAPSLNFMLKTVLVCFLLQRWCSVRPAGGPTNLSPASAL